MHTMAQRGVVLVENTDREIIAALLKSVFEKGLLTEASYRRAQDRLHASTPSDETKRDGKGECVTGGHTKNER